jgi:DNA-binding transcriptional LysR family regulator
MVTYSPGNGELLGGIIQAVRSTNPEVNFRLEQRISTEVGPAVLGGKASVGVCRAVTTKGLMALTLRRISRDHMAVPTDHVLADRDQIGLADLDGETLLASDTATRRWDWAAGVAVRSEHWSTESQVMDSVAAGRGLAIVDEGFIRRNPRPDVVTRPLASSLQPDPIEDYLVWRPDEPSEVARQFIDCAKALVAGGPDTGVEPAATLPRPRLTALPD